MPRIKRVGLVGHCGADVYALRRLIHRTVPNVPIEEVNGTAALNGIARTDSLLLVNRVLDGSIGTTNGVELIRESDPPVVILISNHEDAQTDARGAGARPGFGKADLRSAETADRLRACFDPV